MCLYLCHSDCGLEGSGNVPDGERVVGRLLHLAAMESPGLAKAWFMLAGWCYKWGRKTVDNARCACVCVCVCVCV